MFEKDRDYPTAYVLDEDDDALMLAIRWVLQQAQTSGGSPLLYAPGKQNVSYREPIRAFAARYPVMTPRTRYKVNWGGGPVLAAWPDDKSLGEIADHPRVTALCAVMWGKTLPWAAAAKAVNLDPTATEAGVKLPPIDPVVRQGLIMLGQSVNHSNQLTGSMDHADALAFFRAATRAGLPVDPEALYAHALANGWPGGGADRLRELARKVADGKSLQGWNQPRWRDDVVELWRERAAADSADPDG